MDGLGKPRELAERKPLYGAALKGAVPLGILAGPGETPSAYRAGDPLLEGLWGKTLGKSSLFKKGSPSAVFQGDPQPSRDLSLVSKLHLPPRALHWFGKPEAATAGFGEGNVRLMSARIHDPPLTKALPQATLTAAKAQRADS